MATRYWVGGSGTWDSSSTTNWSASSGGASGASAPTNADTAIFDSNSGTSATVTVDATAVSLSTTINKSDINLSLSGSPTLCTTAGTLTLTAGTLTLNSYTLSVGAVSSSNSNTRTIAFGTGKIDVTGNNKTVWQFNNITNFSYTGTSAVEFSYSGGTGTRTLEHGQTGRTEARAVNWTFTAGSDTTDFVNSPSCLNLIYQSGFSGVGDIPRYIYGNLELSTNQTVATGSTVIREFLKTGGTQTLHPRGKSIDRNFTISGTATVQLLSDLVLVNTTAGNGTLTLTAGGFDANGYAVTVLAVSSSTTGTRTLTMGSGLWTLTGTGTVWNTATTTNLTFNKNTANILLSSTSGFSRTFAGGGLTYNKLTIGGTTGTSTTTFTGSNTFSELASTKTVAHTMTFTAGTTTTVTAWSITGTSGNVVTLGSSTTSAFTLAKAGGGTVSADYLSISYSTATPINTWYAGTNSTDGGNNSGWIFSIPSTGGFLAILARRH